MNQNTKVKWWWNIPIVLMIGILMFLGFRSIITDDNRYGWGTFSKQVTYVVKYYWVDEDGTQFRYFPGNELRGEAKKKLLYKYNTRYSLGAVRSWTTNYAEYMYKNRNQRRFNSFRAEVFYEINKSRRENIDTNKSKSFIVQFPLESGI